MAGTTIHTHSARMRLFRIAGYEDPKGVTAVELGFKVASLAGALISEYLVYLSVKLM